MAENTAPGTGFANIGAGIGSIFSGVFGNNGAGDELSAVFGRPVATNNYTGYGNYGGGQPQTKDNTLLYVGIAIAVIAVLYFVFKN